MSLRERPLFPPPVVDHVLELVGHTPLIRLDAFSPPGGATVWAKAEHLNPTSSVKDRVCLAMLEDAERQGKLVPGQSVVEPTSGNTGIGLAVACLVKGYHLVLTMPESMSLERRALLEAYGVEIVLTPADQVMQGAIAAAEAIVRERAAFMPQQFANPANARAHYDHTAGEILDALGDDAANLRAFVAAVGTGGTISGVGQALKGHDAHVQVIAVEPAASPVLAGGSPGPTKLQGIGAGFVPAIYNPDYVDRIMSVEDRDAYAVKQALAQQMGLLVGITAGANVCIAQRVAAEYQPDEIVVTVLCDSGERYFSLDAYFS